MIEGILLTINHFNRMHLYQCDLTFVCLAGCSEVKNELEINLVYSSGLSFGKQVYRVSSPLRAIWDLERPQGTFETFVEVIPGG